eukprot:7533289-Ditylum_brightwellii.AAC.1
MEGQVLCLLKGMRLNTCIHPFSRDRYWVLNGHQCSIMGAFFSSRLLQPMKTRDLITPICVGLDTTVDPITMATEWHAYGLIWKMAGIENVNTVLQQCSIELAFQAFIITSKGFDSLESFGLLEGDSNITEIDKRLAGRLAGNGHVLLGTVVIKCLQALVYCVKDRQKGVSPWWQQILRLQQLPLPVQIKHCGKN